MKALASLMLSFAAMTAFAEPPCEAVGDYVPVCGFTHPEDLELLPDGHTLIVSEFGDLKGSRAGNLAFFDTRSGDIRRPAAFTEAPTQNWGADHCPSPPGAEFSPHGIHLSKRTDGRQQLLVVNHGGSERVDYFEVQRDIKRQWQLQWRGCVPAPEKAAINDVAALPDGFAVTHMYPGGGWHIGNMPLVVIKSMLGFNTGHVWRYREGEFSVIGGSEAAFPNGIQSSADGKYIFMNAYMNNEVRKIDVDAGKIVGRAKAKHIDNIQWSQDGRLLVASHTGGSFAQTHCLNNPDEVCLTPFTIVAVDPKTMDAEPLFTHEGEPMGAATVAQQIGDKLYMGSFAGDRILVVPMPR